MSTTELVASNRIVIIDDDPKDAEAIRKTLENKHISSLSIIFKDENSLPKKPLCNVRLVFLDLDMLPHVTSYKAKARNAFQVLSKVVDQHNFYILIIWSLHAGSQLEKDFMEVMNESSSSKLRPIVDPIPLSKPKFKNNSSDGYFLEEINKATEEKLKALPSFELLMQWEATITKSKYQFINNIFGNDEQPAISQKLRALAEAYAGKEYKSNIAKYSLLALNETLKGSMNAGIVSEDHFNNSAIDLNTPHLNEKEIARINYELICNPEMSPGPGCVYKIKDCASCEYFEEGLLQGDSEKNSKKIKIDVTPICDNAQQKNLVSHFIHGFLAPKNADPKKANYIYMIPNYFLYKRKEVKLILDLRALKTVPKINNLATCKCEDTDGDSSSSELESSPEVKILFKLKDNIIFDIQHKISGHNSRLGHILLS